MGLMDTINPDARVEIKVGDLYSVLDTAAANGRTAKFLINAINCEVPYRYIREMLTGDKEITEDGDDPVIMTADRDQGVRSGGSHKMDSPSGNRGQGKGKGEQSSVP